MKTKTALHLAAALLAFALLAAPQANAQTVRTWDDPIGRTEWYRALSWSPAPFLNIWATNDTALFQNAGTATTAGIDMSTASLSIGAIHVDGTRTRALTIGNSSATANTGTLTLNGTTVNSISNVILRNASASLLTLQNNETGTGNTMNIVLGNTTTNIILVDGTGGITISSVIQGAGRNLTIAGTNTGTVTLSGANTFSGTLTASAARTSVSGTQSVSNVVVSGGVLSLAASNRFLDTAVVTVSSGTLNFSNFTDTVGSYVQSGGVFTNGTLTATNYALQGGTVAGNLGAGTATVTTGTTTLNGTLGATTVNVNSGTMNLGSADRLTNGAAVTIAGGTLGLGTVNDTVSTFTMTSGILGGTTGTLTAATYALQGGTVNGRLGAGAITVTGGTTTLGSAGRLTNAATLAVNSGQLSLGGAETVAALSGSGGTVALGAHTLTFGGNNANTTFSGAISGSGGGITKTGNGTVTLSGASANTFTGATTVSGGTLQLNKSTGVNAIAGNIALTNSAVLLLSSSGNVADTSAVTLSGGTITRGGNVSEVFGSLSVAVASFLDYGADNAVGTLTFDGTYTGSALLTVQNFLPGNKLQFATSFNAALLPTGGSLSNDNFSFSNGFTTGTEGGFFTITAIPEPSTYLAAAGLLGLMIWPSRKRLIRDAKKILGITPPMRDRLAARSKA